MGGVFWYSVQSPPSSDGANADTTTIQIYAYNADLDQGPGGAQCDAKGLVAVERRIPATEKPLTDALQILLNYKVSPAEKSRGLSSEFPLDGFTLASAVVKDGVATLVFDDPLFKTSGGSCRVAILRAQIEATTRQFNTVHSVRILPEELFQP